MKVINEELQDFEVEALKRKQKRLEAYRKYAKLDESEIITEENLNESALEKVSSLYNYDYNFLKEEILESTKTLTEDTVGDLADKLDAEVVPSKTSDQIFDALDWALKVNERQKRLGNDDYMNLMFVGGAGVGKTARVHQWAKKNNINLLPIYAATLEAIDASGALMPDMQKGRAVKLPSTLLDPLDRPRSVLFLDEYNRAPQDVRAVFLNLIQKHQIPSSDKEGGYREFDNLLFTVVAINPSKGGGYHTDELDRAARNRFARINVKANNMELLNYLNDTYSKEIEAAQKDGDTETVELITGWKDIANLLLKSPKFEFDSDEYLDGDEDSDAVEKDLFVSPRSLKTAIEASDGTKETFLKAFETFCGDDKKKIVETILKDYKDRNDKANDALKSGTDSKVLKNNLSVFDTIMDGVEVED